MEFTGKTAIVTGSARGIGKAIAARLAASDARVVISDVLMDLAEETVREFHEKGYDALAVMANVTKQADVDNLVKTTLEKYQSIDILVNNAGITRDTLLVRMSEEDWDKVLAINLKGAFLATQAIARVMMKQRSGRIINISSVVGRMGNVGQANYAASKAGLIGLTKSAAKELAGRGITVNAVAPGFIATDMTDKLPQAARDAFLNNIPLKRAGTPEDIAAVVAFLASDDAAYITGQVLGVDGGLLM
ncbi:MAG: 3-oxoacyl-[acyl-carrier-protein] reductase [candidate division Zixibacteria bacterium]|nr:3-oxoacyl-[acyl-carrier-protein] reductase [candidate division Zixibacteria bacterium]